MALRGQRGSEPVPASLCDLKAWVFRAVGMPRPVCVPLGTELKTINDFLFQSQIDNINLFKVEALPFHASNHRLPTTCGQDT